MSSSSETKEKIGGFLFKPSSTYEKHKADVLGDIFKYFVKIMVAVMIISVIFLMLPYPRPTAIFFLIAIVLFEFFWLITAFIDGLWTHIWVRLAGNTQSKGVEHTIKATAYGLTPIYALGWIPIVYFYYLFILGMSLNPNLILNLNPASSLITLLSLLSLILLIILPIWCLILKTIGIRQLHGLSTRKATLVVIIALIIPLGLNLLFQYISPIPL